MIMYSWFRVPIFGRSISHLGFTSAIKLLVRRRILLSLCFPFAFAALNPPHQGTGVNILRLFGRCLFWDFGFDHQEFWDFLCPERETCFIMFLHFQSYFEHLLDGQVQVYKKNAKHCKTKVLRDLPNLVSLWSAHSCQPSMQICQAVYWGLTLSPPTAPLPLPFSPEDSHSPPTWGNLYNKKGGMLWIPGWWFHPLWKILVKWSYYSQYMEK